MTYLRNQQPLQKKSGRISVWFLTALILLIPAALISRAFSLFIDEFSQQQFEKKLNAARIEMAQMQSELSEQHVMQTAIQKFAARLGTVSGANLTPQFAAEANIKFRKNFPKASILNWFNNELIATTPAGGPEFEQKRAWQAFARAVFSPDSLDPANSRIADGFIKASISDFLDTNFFAGLLNRCSQISYKGKRHYIAFLKIISRQTTRPAGYLITLIPSENASPFWLQERAMAQASKKGHLVGSYFISNDKAVAGSTIPENLLHGLLTDYRAGRPAVVQNDTFFFSETCFNNPDLFISLGIPVATKDMLLSKALQTIPLLFWLPGLTCIFAGLFRPAALQNLSLKTRFTLTTLIIAVVPLFLALLYSSINTARLRIEEEQNELQRLNQQLISIEDEVARNTAEFEANLKTGVIERFKNRQPDQQSADELFAELKVLGCEVVTILTPDGKAFHGSEIKLERIKQRICYQISFIRDSLIKDGFDIAAIEKTFSRPTADFSIDDMKHDGPNLRQEFHDRILRIEMGPRLFSSFSTYIRDKSGKITGCMMLGIDYRVLRQTFLERIISAKKQPGCRLFTYSQFSSRNPMTPASSSLRNLLILSDLTGDSFDFIYPWQKNSYQILCRPLKDLDNAAMIVRKNELTDLPSGFESVCLLLLVVVTSLLIAIKILGFFDLFFLKPVLNLAEAAAQVENGVFSFCRNDIGRNELSKLQENFTFMLKSLREKAEMKKYLRHELVANAGQQFETGSGRTTVTIMFAGVRNFSDLEKSLSPEEAMQKMNAFLSICEKIVHANGGEIDKFMGETAMASFSCRDEEYGAQRHAVQAAVEIIRESKKHRQISALTIGIGITTGTVIAGKIGSRHKRLDFTYIGDTVNLAARLEKLAGSDGKSGILTTAEAAAELKKHFVITDLEPIRVKGKEKPIEIVSVSGVIT